MAVYGEGTKKSIEVYEECRIFGHQWDPFNPQRSKEFGITLSLRCGKCSAERHEHIAADGTAWGRHYDYPEGYRDSGEYGNGKKYTRPQLRKRFVTRELKAAKTIEKSQKSVKSDRHLKAV